MFDSCDDAQANSSIIELLALAEGGIASYVQEMASQWPLQNRDACYRTYGEKLLCFAGEMSWGDEPGGSGYRWLKRVEELGLNEIFGIE